MLCTYGMHYTLDLVWCVIRYDRIQRKHAMQKIWDEITAREIEALIVEEVESIIKKQVNKAKQYFKPSTTSEEMEALHKELSKALQTVKQLKDELALKDLPSFCEEDFKSDDFTWLCTGLPNIGMI